MLHRFLHNKTAVGTVTIVLIVAFMGLFAPFIAPHDPYATNILNKFAHFSKEYPLGTDNLGRCILSRMIYGIRPTLGLAVLTMLGTIGPVSYTHLDVYKRQLPGSSCQLS